MPATPVANGEHAAEAEAKAKAKAEADRLASEKAAGEKVLGPIAALAVKAANGFAGFAAKLEEAHLTLGRAVFAVEEVLVSHPAIGLSIAAWCEANIPSVSGPVFGSSPAYRGLQAARCAAVADEKFAILSVNALRAGHREKGRKGALNRVYAKAAKAAGGIEKVRESHVADALESLYPKTEANTPGPAKGTEAAKSGANAKAAKTRNTPTEPTEKPDLAVSGPRLGAAKVRLDTLFANVSQEDRGTAYALALTVLRSCEDHGTAATRIALSAFEPKAEAAKTRKTRKTAS